MRACHIPACPVQMHRHNAALARQYAQAFTEALQRVLDQPAAAWVTSGIPLCQLTPAPLWRAGMDPALGANSYKDRKKTGHLRRAHIL